MSPVDRHGPNKAQGKRYKSERPQVVPKEAILWMGSMKRTLCCFFDEEHTLKVADIVKQSSTVCEVHVVVNWHASIWSPPAACSTRLMMDADQTWELKRLPDGQLVVSKYIVNSMTYEPGSCKL